jgi:catechol 2,3-dioxygenase-like lactoylglutathione lyase family enzyme
VAGFVANGFLRHHRPPASKPTGGTSMSRGLDHIVHAVRDLDAAAALYSSIGFTVGARNRHPWGTHNYLVQLPGFFIELLTLAEPNKLGDDGISRLFGSYTGDFLKRGEGLSLMILQSDDAEADEADFRTAGIAVSEAMRFEREGKRPDSSPVKVAFSLAFAEDRLAPDIHFAVCQQHYPENFWNPAFQKHANGVTGLAGVVVVADAPPQHRAFFEAFVGAKAVDGESGMSLPTPRGRIDLLTPAAFTGRYGVAPPDVSRGARLAAIRFAVADPSLMQSVPELAGLAGVYAGSPTVIGADDAMGATLIFEAGR